MTAILSLLVTIALLAWSCATRDLDDARGRVELRDPRSVRGRLWCTGGATDETAPPEDAP